ncbi:MAG: hypothetical protein AAFN79_00750 [Pseudomonadota bacterium]
MTRARKRERGAALLIALGGLALVSALAAAALSLATGPATRAEAALERAAAMRAAEATVHRLAAAMAARDLRAAAPLDGTVISTEFFGADVGIAGQDVGGLIDLNVADRPALARLFALFAPGAAENSAEDFADALIEARAADGAGRGGFAGREEALAALPEDLRAAALTAFDHATVHSGRAQVDPSTATAPALAAAANVPLDAAQRYVADRLLNGRRAALPEGADLSALAVSDLSTARITVRAATPGGGRAAVTAVIRATSSPRAPVRFLAWR